MADHALFPAKVVTPDGLAFDGEVQELDLTSVSGGLGILARRAPIVADLRRGYVRAQLEDGTWRTWASSVGFAQASNSIATVVVEEAVELANLTDAECATAQTDAVERLAEIERDTETGDSHDAQVAAARKRVEWLEHVRELRERFSK